MLPLPPERSIAPGARELQNLHTQRRDTVALLARLRPGADLEATLTDGETTIEAREASLNALIFALYNLSDAERALLS